MKQKPKKPNKKRKQEIIDAQLRGVDIRCGEGNIYVPRKKK